MGNINTVAYVLVLPVVSSVLSGVQTISVFLRSSLECLCLSLDYQVLGIGPSGLKTVPIRSRYCVNWFYVSW